MKRYLLSTLLLFLPYFMHTTAIDGQTLWSLSAKICNETEESFSKLCVIDSTLDNLSFDFDDEISIIEEIICSKIADLATCFMITQEDIDAGPGFTISTPGKYCLAENVIHTSASAAITIAADNVTIDLDAHTIDGTSTATNGIVTTGTRENIIIKNGSITSCEMGVNIDSTSQVCISDLIVKQSSNDAIEISNSNNIVIKNCFIANTATSAIVISLSNNCTIKNCIVQNNTGIGFAIGNSTNTAIINCKAIENGSTGFLISGTSDNITICQCIALSNGNNGFFADGVNVTNTTLLNNKSIANLGAGLIDTATNTSAFTNLAHSNGTDYLGIADPIETTPTVTTGYWTNVDQ